MEARTQTAMDQYCRNLGILDSVTVENEHANCENQLYARYDGLWRCWESLSTATGTHCMSTDGVSRTTCQAGDGVSCTRNAELLRVAYDIVQAMRVYLVRVASQG